MRKEKHAQTPTSITPSPLTAFTYYTAGWPFSRVLVLDFVCDQINRAATAIDNEHSIVDLEVQYSKLCR
jgi:hypothetical protein